MPARRPRTLMDVLRARAEARPEALAYAFLEGDAELSRSLSYGEALARASAIAGALTARGAASRRALLLYPPGLDYVEAFLACLAAGVVAVPAYPPDPSRLRAGLVRLRAVAADADVSFVLTTKLIESFARELVAPAPELAAATWIATDAAPSASAAAGASLLAGQAGGGALALLQYTSGSTAAPKGVMVSHDNLLANLEDLERAEPNDASTVSLSWLPAYHDMGLIEGILHPLYGGYPAYLMAPSAFLERPLRWLRAISSLRVTNSGGPNFAYDLCARKATPADLEALDLSSWRVAYNGAEPVRAETLRRFLAVFGPRGMRPRAFYPVYGLAEATLLVTTNGPDDEPQFELVAAERALAGAAPPPKAGERARELVACGAAPRTTRVVIVDPERRARKAEGEIGEIWIAGPGVAQGYWGRPAETERAFHASIEGSGEGPFLRSGDVGFLRSGQLFITGRIKDCIVIRGESHAAHDIEQTAEASFPAARPGCSAAFALSLPSGEAAAIVVEVNLGALPSGDAGAALSAAIVAIRGAVAKEHGIALATVALAPPRSVPKTSSGKVRRSACRDELASGELAILSKWSKPEEPPEPPPPGDEEGDGSVAALAWLRRAIAARAGVDAPSIDPAASLPACGLDSLASVEIVTEAASRFGRRDMAALLLEQPSVGAIAELLAGGDGRGASADGGSSGQVGGRPARPSLEARQIEADMSGLFDVDPSLAEPSIDGPPRVILLTGATGFLGGFLLRELLDRTGARVVCLARGGASRARASLRDRGLLREGDDERVEVIEGDLRAPSLGLAPDLYGRLAIDVDAIYHSAAAVNWVYSYGGLRDVNVLGTAELLRLASRGRRKEFHFVSTIAACHFIEAPSLELREDDDVMPLLPWMRLGYVRSKVVAEALVTRARERGLPAFIYRPSFIVGDSEGGSSNTSDFLCSLLKGCIQTGSAPDLEWSLDVCTVDHAARAIVALSARRQGRRPTSGADLANAGRTSAAEEGESDGGEPRLPIAHISGPSPRPFRDLVVWLNALGYRVALKPYAAWLDDLDRSPRSPSNALDALRPFFARRARLAGGPPLSLPELYEDSLRPIVDSSRTRALLAQLGVESPPLDARLLDLIIQSLRRARFLDAPPEPPRRAPRSSSSRPSVAGPPLDARTLEPALRRGLDDPSFTIERLRLDARRSESSVMSELTSLWHDRPSGLYNAQIAYTSRKIGGASAALSAFVKIKPPDEAVLDVGRSLAGACGEPVFRAYEAARGALAARGCHARELAVYAEDDERFRRHTPAVYASLRDDERGLWALVLEDIAGLPLFDSGPDAAGWGAEAIEAAVRGVAELHAIHYGRERDLLAAPERAGSSLCALSGALAMRPLWRALAGYASPIFAPFYGEEGRAAHLALADEVERWWPGAAALPRTRIHNDFNPRNIALRPDRRLCAYDWELAVVGAPARDLAELLCFVLPPRAAAESAPRFLELHRTELERATGSRIDRELYGISFRSSLAELCVDRLSMYAMINAVRRQRFLPRVVAAWWSLYSWASSDRSGER